MKGTGAGEVDRFLEVLPGVVRDVREKLGAPVAGGAGDAAATATADALGRAARSR